MSRKSFLILTSLGVAGLVIGTWGVVEALWLGIKATNLTSYVHWGLGVATYLYFIGLSAGAFLCTLLSLLLGRREFDELAGLGAFVALVMEICAGIAINLDLGHWERGYQFLLTPNLESPMFWMLILYTAMLIIYALKLFYLATGQASRSKAMSWLSIPVSLLFYGINGVLFAILTNRPLWQEIGRAHV
jgi:molybdopterin-containing oxidoreductase family membrane subunit